MFRGCVLSTDWREAYESLDAEHAYSVILSLFKTIYKKHFSYKYIKRSKKIRNPWITPALLDKIKTKTLSTKNSLILGVVKNSKRLSHSVTS